MIIELLVLAGAGWVGFNIGANDAGYCVGTCVGSGTLAYRRVIVLAAISVFVGGLLGTNVTRTIAQDIVPAQTVTPTHAVSCLFSAGTLGVLATFLGVPVSTSHAVVLGLVGCALATGSVIQVHNVLMIVGAWIILPFVMIVFSFILVRSLEELLSKVTSLVSLEIALKYMLMASSVYASMPHLPLVPIMQALLEACWREPESLAASTPQQSGASP